VNESVAKTTRARSQKKTVTESKKVQYTDKFQRMLEYLVNEDQSKAEDLFHQIVVEKSRQIYENLLAEEDHDKDEKDDDEDVELQSMYSENDDEDVEESDEEEVDESDDEEVDESDDEDVDEDYYDEADDDLEMGGDPEGDLSMDMDDEEGGMDDEEGDMGDGDMDMDAEEGGEVTQDQIADLEAELADLKAEFEELMADDEGGDDDMDMGSDEGGDDMDMGDEEGGEDEMGDDDMDMEEPAEEESFHMENRKNQPKSAAEQMREYVEKIAGPNFPGPGKMGDNGVQTKSPVASKNDMGGTTANIVNTGTTNATVTASKGQLQGAAMQSPVPKVDDMGNVNKPGAKAAKSFYKPNGKGHGAEKTGAMSKETQADKSAGSPLNGAPKRAK
jgi:hypothetical protein